MSRQSRNAASYELVNWQHIFQQIDQDNDGLILRSDLKKYLLKYPLSDVQLPEYIVDAILEHVDFNNDGFIDLQEFYKLVNIQTDYVTRRAIRRALVKGALSVAPRSQVSHSDRIYIEQYLCCPPPLIIPLLCIAEIGVFVYEALKTKSNLGPYSPVDLKSPLVFDPHKRAEAWRFLTYMLVHAGYAHLISNVFVSLLLGIPLEMVHRWWRIFLLYMSGVIFGSIVASIFSPHAYLVGASGGCYALIAAHLANIIINWKEMPFNWLRLIAFTILVGVDIGTFVYFTVNKKDNSISYSAHVAGFIAGLLVGMVALRNLKEHKWEIVLKWAGFAIFLVMVILAIIIHIFFPDVVGLYTNKSSVFPDVNGAAIISTA
ncbi:Rhomboid-related protein 1 [Armadillidium nasatum]|uniref:Rhomboid-related protein 1 n=1 Tax=Armadillidium nasatum TaxID=96803 RepID=A0A5N5SJB3_9CRUS|nr:Rhomboid-related protein 1 [Armadillidium nasatum]